MCLLIWSVGRIYFFAVVGLRSLGLRGLSAEGPAFLGWWPPFSIFRASMADQPLSHFESLLSLPYRISLASSAAFKGPCDFIGPTLVIQEDHPILRSAD